MAQPAMMCLIAKYAHVLWKVFFHYSWVTGPVNFFRWESEGINWQIYWGQWCRKHSDLVRFSIFTWNKSKVTFISTLNLILFISWAFHRFYQIPQYIIKCVLVRVHTLARLSASRESCCHLLGKKVTWCIFYLFLSTEKLFKNGQVDLRVKLSHLSLFK